MLSWSVKWRSLPGSGVGINTPVTLAQQALDGASVVHPHGVSPGGNRLRTGGTRARGKHSGLAAEAGLSDPGQDFRDVAANDNVGDVIDVGRCQVHRDQTAPAPMNPGWKARDRRHFQR